MSRARPLVLDSTVFSNFASSESVSWLTDTFPDLETSPSVERELRNGVEEGYSFLRSAVRAIDDAEVSVHGSVGEIATSSETLRVFRRLDRGEAEALIIAEQCGGTLGTDDRAARNLADERTIPTTGSIGLLVTGIHRDLLSEETADEWLDTWQEECGYYAPVERISEALS